MRLVYATSNPGKFAEVSKMFAGHGLTLHSPQEFEVELTVEETGKTLEENAVLKAEAYSKALDANCVTIGDDTGLEVKALGGEPGIRVRRWQGHEMTDEEIISYCLERMKNVPKGKRQAQFRTVLAVVAKGHKTRLFSGTYRGSIRTRALAVRQPGFPFRSLFVGTNPTHRVQAIDNALPYLRQLAYPT